MRNRQKNRAKTFSLLLLKEKGAVVGEGAPIVRDETTEQKTLFLILFEKAIEKQRVLKQMGMNL